MKVLGDFIKIGDKIMKLSEISFIGSIRNHDCTVWDPEQKTGFGIILKNGTETFVECGSRGAAIEELGKVEKYLENPNYL